MSENNSYVRCDKTFCSNRYKVITLPSSKVNNAICDVCGNTFEKVTKKQAKQYFDGEYISPKNNNHGDKFEKLGKSVSSSIKNPSDRTMNILITVAVIIVFALMVAYCDVQDGPPAFFGDVK